MARRVGVSQSTLWQAVQEGRVTPDAQVVRGQRTYSYFRASVRRERQLREQLDLR